MYYVHGLSRHNIYIMEDFELYLTLMQWRTQDFFFPWGWGGGGGRTPNTFFFSFLKKKKKKIKKGGGGG